MYHQYIPGGSVSWFTNDGIVIATFQYLSPSVKGDELYIHVELSYDKNNDRIMIIRMKSTSPQFDYVKVLDTTDDGLYLPCPRRREATDIVENNLTI